MVRGWSAGGPGKDNLDPVEDVLNENPSLVALGNILGIIVIFWIS